MDGHRHEAAVLGEEVELTPTEFRMLAAFSSTRDRLQVPPAPRVAGTNVRLLVPNSYAIQSAFIPALPS